MQTCDCMQSSCKNRHRSDLYCPTVHIAWKRVWSIREDISGAGNNANVRYGLTIIAPFKLNDILQRVVSSHTVEGSMYGWKCRLFRVWWITELLPGCGFSLTESFIRPLRWKLSFRVAKNVLKQPSNQLNKDFVYFCLITVIGRVHWSYVCAAGTRRRRKTPPPPIAGPKPSASPWKIWTRSATGSRVSSTINETSPKPRQKRPLRAASLPPPRTAPTATKTTGPRRTSPWSRTSTGSFRRGKRRFREKSPGEPEQPFLGAESRRDRGGPRGFGRGGAWQNSGGSGAGTAVNQSINLFVGAGSVGGEAADRGERWDGGSGWAARRGVVGRLCLLHAAAEMCAVQRPQYPWGVAVESGRVEADRLKGKVINQAINCDCHNKV